MQLDYVTKNRAFTVQAKEDSTCKTVIQIKDKNASCIFCVDEDGGVRMPKLPTSPSGLPSGSLWNSGGYIKIV